MHMKKALGAIAILLLVSFLLYLVFLNPSQTKLESVEAVNILNEEQVEDLPETNAAEEVEQLVEANTLEQPTITEDLKDKVREVLDVAINLFTKEQKIVAIGDSLTQGVGDETEKGGYVGILNHTFEDNNINIEIENIGKRGNRSDQLLKRLEKEEIAASIKEADTVLITIGANDIMKIVKSNFTNLTLEPFQKELPNYVVRLTAILDRINGLNPDAQIYLIGFYNPFERYFSDIYQLQIILNDWNTAGKSLTEEYANVHFIPTQDLFLNGDIDLLADDQFHPNTSGYKLIAKRVLEHLEINEETDITPEDVE
ncbi:SGNH/GDSL hydrolase family protein [Bacillus suaedae]|uniref:SGNH/GDSL hydrolase family protein n=1 Tax=Halalkalibacter suaedae TaxID=2822140 RepID=A0A940WQK5_9BACI|nr:SGNH/GDSL hydrolase family protein [Bacillus suaedae]MBP3950705.1 SGNH/GDSL hydrolase family protein [Bacillus suaedae]